MTQTLVEQLEARFELPQTARQSEAKILAEAPLIENFHITKQKGGNNNGKNIARGNFFRKSAKSTPS
jgi:hypothetical protein